MKLICYLSNGYPTIERSLEIVDRYFEAGCDIVEIDFPARSPYLDSAFIRSRMKRALDVCGDYSRYMDAISEACEKYSGSRFVVLVYEETIEEIGIDSFIDFCRRNALLDIIYIGSTRTDFKIACMDQGLRIATYVPFHLPKDDLAAAERTNGFIYLQYRPEPSADLPFDTLGECIGYVRRNVGIDSSRPIYCGVGVESPEDIRRIKESGGDGAFIGSVVLKLHDNPREMKTLIRSMKNATLEMSK